MSGASAKRSEAAREFHDVTLPAEEKALETGRAEKSEECRRSGAER